MQGVFKPLYKQNSKMGCCIFMQQAEPLEWYDAAWRIGIDFFCVFSIMKVLMWAISTTRNQIGSANKITASPPIKPTNYQNQDLHLRRCLVTMHWKLIANKSRALYYMKMCSCRRRSAIRVVSPKLNRCENAPNTLLRTCSVPTETHNLTVRRTRSLGEYHYKNFP